MKKSIKIATLGVAALGFAGAPLAGVVSAIASDDTEFTDTIQVTLAESCTFSSDGAQHDTNTINGISPAAVTVANGHLYNTEGGGSATAQSSWSGTYNVYCNDNGGWYVTAEGASNVTKGNAVNAMAPSTLAKEEAIATGTATSGTDANWAFKLAKGNGAAETVAIETGYSNYTSVPATAKTVVKSNASTTAAGKGTFTTAYQVYVGTDTKADTYTGAVKYVLGHPASAAPVVTP